MSGSRDALCRLLDSEVAVAQEAADGLRLEVRTSRGGLLVTDGGVYPYPQFARSLCWLINAAGSSNLRYV